MIDNYLKCDSFADDWNRTIEAYYEPTIISMKQMRNDMIRSPFYGLWIWDNNLSDFAEFFDREYFGKVWPTILYAMEYAGTYNAFHAILQAALGEDVPVTFDLDNEPYHLQITIGKGPQMHLIRADTTSGDAILYAPDISDAKITARADVKALTANQTRKLLELVKR